MRAPRRGGGGPSIPPSPAGPAARTAQRGRGEGPSPPGPGPRRRPGRRAGRAGRARAAGGGEPEPPRRAEASRALVTSEGRSPAERSIEASERVRRPEHMGKTGWDGLPGRPGPGGRAPGTRGPRCGRDSSRCVTCGSGVGLALQSKPSVLLLDHHCHTASFWISFSSLKPCTLLQDTWL
ncbi:uncharacterized protein ACOB8E_014950 [Sarcophilus harrisii]